MSKSTTVYTTLISTYVNTTVFSSAKYMHGFMLTSIDVIFHKMLVGSSVGIHNFVMGLTAISSQ